MAKKYSNKELQNMSVEELRVVKNQLQQSNRTTPAPSQPGQPTPNQVTLHSGDTITLPTYPENPPTSTSRDFYTCENDWCCCWSSCC